MGYDAAVVAQVERRSGLKRYAGHPLFVYAAFATWFRHYDRQPAPLHGAPSPTARRSTTGYFALCLNTNPYTYLGNRPLDLAPGGRRSTAAWSSSRSARSRFAQTLRHRRLPPSAAAGDLRELPYVDVPDRPARR